MTIPPRSALRALVTRPRAEAGDLARALAARGIEAVIEPLIDIRFRDAPVDLAGAQAVLCTSANGVRALARADAGRSVPVFAIGDATAARARTEGFGTVESAGGDVGDLAGLVRGRLRPEDGRLVHVAGSEVAGDLAGALRAAGFAIDRAVLYDSVAATALSTRATSLLAAGAIGLALFFSPRTAAIFARLADGIDLRDTAAISISAAADAALAGIPFRERAVAPKPTQAALLDRVDQLTAVSIP